MPEQSAYIIYYMSENATKMERYGGVSKTYICPVCGRLFLVPFQTKGGGHTEWVYVLWNRRKKKYLCSYRCFSAVKEKMKNN